jgi:hypothetical protein
MKRARRCKREKFKTVKRNEASKQNKERKNEGKAKGEQEEERVKQGKHLQSGGCGKGRLRLGWL